MYTWKEDLIIIMCFLSFLSSVPMYKLPILMMMMMMMIITISQVYKIFMSDANFIVNFVGKWIRLVFAHLLVKIRKNPP